MQNPIFSLEIASILFLALGVFFTVIQLFLIRRQVQELRKNTNSQNEWKRRQITQQYLHQVIAKDVPVITQKLEKEFNVDINNTSQTAVKVMDELSEKKKSEFKIETKALYNLFELISVGIKNNILDDEIAYQFAGLVFAEYWRWGEDFVHIYQKNNRSVWIEFETIAKEWKKRLIDNEEKLVRPGKPPI